MNTNGQLLRITTFGESHGPALGVVIDGFPAGFCIDRDYVRFQMARRKTGQSAVTSARREDDENFEVLSGMFEGHTTGHPITIIVRNTNAHSKDYSNLKDIFRPNHADLTYHLKYGIRDYAGGGRSSARETVSRVLAGAIAQQYMREMCQTEFFAYSKQIGHLVAQRKELHTIEDNIVRTCDPDIAPAMIALIQEVAKDGDSIGGVLECTIQNPPIGLGEPVFDKIKSRLARGMMSIGGFLGFEYGAGFAGASMRGSQYNESFVKNQENGQIESLNNRYGGILGGISTGEDIVFRVALKPTSSILKPQTTVDTSGHVREFQISGRHDPCLLPRAVPIIEAMAALDIMDLYLIHRARK